MAPVKQSFEECFEVGQNTEPMIELLSPAGSLKAMRYAFAYGADAVYAGLPRYSLRARNNSFRQDNIEIGIKEAHAQGKQFFLTTNLMPHNDKVRTFMKHMEPLIKMGPDALIMADPGLIMLVREEWPDMPIHLSVQANTVNYAAVKFWHSVGVSRVILSRELSLKEIEEIRQRCPEMEIEVFVHGALCIAYSGRCLLSGYFNHRDANQGTCTNACRWEYGTTPAAENAEGDLLPQSSGCGCGPAPRLLEDKSRPGKLMPMEEDEHGTYILNSKDLRAVEHVEKLVEIGVNCLKIEGRTKSPYYVARTAQVYRQAIDDATAGRPFNPTLVGVLENLASRGYTDGFFKRHQSQEYQNYMQGYSRCHQQQYVGEVIGFENGYAHIEVKNKFGVGDRLEIVTPEGNRDYLIETLEDLQGNPMSVAPGSGHFVRIPSEVISSPFGMLTRYLEADAPVPVG